jgi:hypothetical protein
MELLFGIYGRCFLAVGDILWAYFLYPPSCRSQVKFDHYASWAYLEEQETGGLVERELERDRNELDRNELCEGYQVTMPAMPGALPGRLGDVLFSLTKIDK